MSFEKMYIVWICAGIIFGVLEAVTVQLVSVWFVIGSCAALVSSLLGAKLYVQIIVFIVTSVLMLLITRPIVKKKLTVKVEPTNADRCIGLIATVIEDINNIDGTGLVKVDGKIWTARSSDSSIIEKGTKVIIEKIDGVKLIVKKEIAYTYIKDRKGENYEIGNCIFSNHCSNYFVCTYKHQDSTAVKSFCN